MSGDLKDILSHLNPNIDQETLLLYLQGKLSAEKQHELEKEMLQGDFEADALEGLSAIHDKNKIEVLVEQLKLDLNKKTLKKKKKPLTDAGIQPWLIISLIVILVLIVISYVIIYLYTKGQ
jgi:hypothetical protein